MGLTSFGFGLMVLRNVVIHEKNPITITMVFSMVWVSIMLLLQGLLLLMKSDICKVSFIVVYKLTMYGIDTIMACDFLVAKLYLRNAVALYTDKCSTILTKTCLFTFLALFVAVIITMIVDVVNTS